MAGHSKWANIKHKKAKEDAKRGQMFTKIARQIMVAAKEGGSDPETNFRLRLAMDNAKSVNMPNDNIERAISRGAGDLGGENYEEIVYEGYGPNGVAILMDALTDNRNRTASELRHCFSKLGGNLGESGCVAWMFDKKGLLVLEREDIDEDELMLAALEAGAADVESEGDVMKVITEPTDFSDVRSKLEKEGFSFLASEITMLPKNTVAVDDDDLAVIERLIESLEDLDDVQQVYANYI